MARVLLMDESDNVATAVSDLKPGDEITVSFGKKKWNLQAEESIPFGHKIALQLIPAKGEIRKYGEVIGKASRAIRAGTHVHVHNLKSTRR